MDLLNEITSWILTVFSVLVAFKGIYYVIGFFAKPKEFASAKENHRYAVVVAARNEECVIGNLLKSLSAQDYPKDLLTVFVVADNCTDRTAEIAREHGAVVYERFDPTKARKGWALEFLFENIARDYGIESFEGYFFFDADNVVTANFVKEMNNVFDSGARVVNGYRCAKNFDANCISAAYGVHWCKSMLCMHRPRTLLSTTTHFAGTGFLLASECLKEGWHYHCLTEDTELCIDLVARGYKIVACESAVFFDEQPVSFKIACRQRMRWIKGRLAVFFKAGHKLLLGIFRQKGIQKFSCYDIFFYVFPYGLFTLFVGAIYPVTSAAITFFSGGALPVLSWLKGLLLGAASLYLSSFLEGIVVLIREQKHVYCSRKKQLVYAFLIPWFHLVTIPLSLLCLILKIEWKVIPHEDETAVEEVIKKKE